KIEALIQRASSEGERQAAQLAKERVLTKIYLDKSNEPVEYRVSLESPWEKKLFVAICQKHGFQTYRYQRQKYTTARLKISKNMMNEVVWPDYLQYSKMLNELVEDIMQDLINKIHKIEDEVVIAGEIDFKQA
ncbi:MAG: hypothetical protein AB7E68_05995, partial [Candidatus Babeliales bacterium]